MRLPTQKKYNRRKNIFYMKNKKEKNLLGSIT